MDYTLLYIIAGILILPAIILSLIAQTKVNSTFDEYSQKVARSGYEAQHVAQMILDARGIQGVAIQKVKGNLTDSYNDKKKLISLSENVYGSNTVSAIGVACHECGHALQYKDGYMPIKIRNFIVPIANFSSKLLLPLIIIGILFNAFYIGGIMGSVFIWAGVIFYGLSFLLNLITLPIEFDASKRALNILSKTGILDDEELKGAGKVLRSAAFTYVASTLVSLLYFLRFLFLILSISKRD